METNKPTPPELPRRVEPIRPDDHEAHRADQRGNGQRDSGNGNGHDEHHEENPIPHDLPKVSTAAVGVAAIVIVAAFAVLFFVGWLPSHRQQQKLDAEAKEQDTRPVVEVMVPVHQDKTFDLNLPADVHANQDTFVYPRTNGYLKRLLVDIGDHVEANQLLAEIETPETDADLNQAKAAQGQSEANLKKSQDDLALAQTTYARYQNVGPTGGVTQQELDEKRAAFTQAQSAMEAEKANVTAAKAAVDRLVSLQGFEKVFAPFSGKITARSFDVGALLSPTSSMFRVTQDDTIRVYVNVPQPYISSLKIGESAKLTVPRNYPGKDFIGTVARSSDAIDLTNRTLRFEIDFPNKDGQLFAGMYGNIILKVKPEKPPIMVPTSAVVFDSEGTKVWYVEDNKAHTKKVELGRDYGTEVEVPTGLTGDETIITNPGERLADGGDVSVMSDNAPKPVQQAEAK